MALCDSDRGSAIISDEIAITEQCYVPFTSLQLIDGVMIIEPS